MKKRILYGVVVTVLLCCVLAIWTSAEIVNYGACGEQITWELDDTGILTIYGEGEMWDYNKNETPWHYDKYDIRKIVFDGNITRIGNNAFRGFWITEFIFPNSLNSIGEYAFADCRNLTQLEFPNELETIERGAFDYCSNLEEIFFGENLKSIGYHTFHACKKLKRVIFPDTLLSIGGDAFQSCYALESITIQSNIDIADYAFENTNLKILIITDNVSVIDPTLYVESLSEIQVQGNDNVGYVSFDGVLYSYDDYLESYTLIRYPAAKIGGEYITIHGTESIQKGAFTKCDNLTHIGISDSVQTVGSYAFNDCSNLTTISWGKSISTIAGKIIDGSPVSTIIMSSESITYPEEDTITEYIVEGVKENGYTDIEGVLFYFDATKKALILKEYPNGRTDKQYDIPDGTSIIGDNAFKNNVYLTDITFPSSINEICSMAFDSCKSLSKVTLNDGIKTIGTYSFEKCSSLKEINFPNTLTQIGIYAFQGCSYLKEIILPSSLDSILFGAFSGCTALRSACFLGDVPPSLGNDIFMNTHSTFTIYYVEGRDGWTTPTWNGYPAYPRNVIEEPNFTVGDINGDTKVDISDALCLFMYSMLPDMYPISYLDNVDFTNDGVVDISDALHLFMYSMLPDQYPIA